MNDIGSCKSRESIVLDSVLSCIGLERRREFVERLVDVVVTIAIEAP